MDRPDGKEYKREREITSTDEAPATKRAKIQPAAAAATASLPSQQTEHNDALPDNQEEISNINATTTSSSSSSSSSSSTSSSSTSGVVVSAAAKQAEDRVVREISYIDCSVLPLSKRTHKVRTLLLQMDTTITYKILMASLEYLDAETLRNLLSKLSMQERLKVLNEQDSRPLGFVRQKRNLLSEAIQFDDSHLIPVLLEHGAEPNQLNLFEKIFAKDNLIDQMRLLDLLVSYGLQIQTFKAMNQIEESSRSIRNNQKRKNIRALRARINQIAAAIPRIRANRELEIYINLWPEAENTGNLPQDLVNIINEYDASSLPLQLPPNSPEVIQLLESAGYTDAATSTLPYTSLSSNISTNTSTNTSSTTSTSSTSHTVLPRATAATAGLAASGNR